MASFKALIVMVIWTAIAFYGLFAIGAAEQANFRTPLGAVGIGISLLVIHMINMALYFKIAGERPFEWFR